MLYTGLLLPLSVFLYTGFVRALPHDYEEAAFIDGASRWQAFTRIVFPLLSSVTGTVAVLTALIVWNDFFTAPPGVLWRRRQQPHVARGDFSFVGEYESQWNVVFAAVAIALAPVLGLYFFAQRNLIPRLHRRDQVAVPSQVDALFRLSHRALDASRPRTYDISLLSIHPPPLAMTDTSFSAFFAGRGRWLVYDAVFLPPVIILRCYGPDN